MKIIVLSREKFARFLNLNKITLDNIEKQQELACISICNVIGEDSIPFFPKDYNNYKTFHFDDVDSGENSFNEEQGIQLIEFLKKNKDKNLFVVHCSAGISRSGAVGTFINDFFKRNYFIFKQQNPQILPNQRVLQILNKLTREEGF